MIIHLSVPDKETADELERAIQAAKLLLTPLKGAPKDTYAVEHMPYWLRADLGVRHGD
jgi:hypothetical protein